MPAANVRRRGMGSPERRTTRKPRSKTPLGSLIN
jgi:hypothetical protein